MWRMIISMARHVYEWLMKLNRFQLQIYYLRHGSQFPIFIIQIVHSTMTLRKSNQIKLKWRKCESTNFIIGSNDTDDKLLSVTILEYCAI